MLQENISLKPYNTFGIEATAKYFIAYEKQSQLPELIEQMRRFAGQVFILGGGSNVLFLKNYEGLIVHPQNKGINIVRKTPLSWRVRVQAGEVWDNFVAWAVKNKVSGVENLSGIPGSVGASVVQNIGAYGVEVKDAVVQVEAIDVKTGELVYLSAAECEFDYRHSAFKTKYKDTLMVLSVEFELGVLVNARLSYSGLQEAVYKIGKASLENIRTAVIKLRSGKLPDPAKIGNAGSFFKNPIISQDEATAIQTQHPSVPLYPAAEGSVKIAAGWLIEQCGWKGHCNGAVGVHDKQALVLVNLGGATGQDVIALSDEICSSVFEKFKINLTPEVIFV